MKMRVVFTKLSDLPINRKIIDLLTKNGITTLFPPQKDALQTGVLDGRNLVLAVPTSAGKTLIAEICMLRSILSGRGKALYLVPLRSLAFEKYHDFKKYEQLGIITAMSVGDFDISQEDLQNADILVLTTERADSLIRHDIDWLSELGIVVVDEIHLLNDPSRGPTLEMVLATIITANPHVQTVSLSATISNANELAVWLNADLVKSTWRPIPLREGVYYNGRLLFDDGTTRTIRGAPDDALANLVSDILDEEGQILVFVSSRRATVAAARLLTRRVRKYLSEESKSYLAQLARKIASGQSVPDTTRVLATLISQGTAFHHAGLSNQERILIETAFRANHLKVIVATPTLAAGVNLPARRVIIRDYRRYEANRGSLPIPILEYKQMSGRAGRPKYDSYGEAILIAKTERELDFLMEHYIHSEPEEITSKLASQKALRFHLLALIAGDLVSTSEDIQTLLSRTFFSSQFDQHAIASHISAALNFLEMGGLIHNDDVLSATKLGERTAKLYIDPESAILFRNVLFANPPLTDESVLHLICHTPDQPLCYLNSSETDDYGLYVEDHFDELLIPPPYDPADYRDFLREIKTSFVLLDWINEQTDRDITDRYNVGVGDIHRYVQTATWLLYSAAEISRLVASNDTVSFLQTLSERMRHGVRKELLELVRLKGIGRVRARMLYSHDIRTLSDLLTTDPVSLARIPTIGTSLAKSILEQVGVKVDVQSDVTTDDEDETPLLDQALLDEYDL